MLGDQQGVPLSHPTFGSAALNLCFNSSVSISVILTLAKILVFSGNRSRIKMTETEFTKNRKGAFILSRRRGERGRLVSQKLSPRSVRSLEAYTRQGLGIQESAGSRDEEQM